MATAKKEEEPLKVQVVSPIGAEKTPEEQKIAEAQAEQLYGKAEDHAPSKPVRADWKNFIHSGLPPAQEENITEEQKEFYEKVSADNYKLPKEPKK